MARLKRFHDRLLDAFGLLAGCAFAAIAALVTVDVALRNLGIGNLPWLLEVAEYALYVATFVAAPWVLRQGAHVRVDLLLNVCGRGAARALERIADAAGAAVSLVLFWYGTAALLDSFRLGSLIFKELVIPEWWLLAFIPLTTALLALEFALRLARGPADGADDGAAGGAVRDGL